MSYEVGKQALDFLIANSGSRRNLEGDFFGGEPLMNWDVVKRLVAYGREQRRSTTSASASPSPPTACSSTTTSSTSPTGRCDNVVLSLDGRKEVHDRLRRTAGDKGSYDIIVPSSRSWWRPGAERATTSGAPSPTTTWISPRTSSTWRTWALRAVPGAGGLRPR